MKHTITYFEHVNARSMTVDVSEFLVDKDTQLTGSGLLRFKNSITVDVKSANEQLTPLIRMERNGYLTEYYKNKDGQFFEPVLLRNDTLNINDPKSAWAKGSEFALHDAPLLSIAAHEAIGNAFVDLDIQEGDRSFDYPLLKQNKRAIRKAVKSMVMFEDNLYMPCDEPKFYFNSNLSTPYFSVRTDMTEPTPFVMSLDQLESKQDEVKNLLVANVIAESEAKSLIKEALSYLIPDSNVIKSSMNKINTTPSASLSAAFCLSF